MPFVAGKSFGRIQKAIGLNIEIFLKQIGKRPNAGSS
jgi:hypothetical protein